MELILILYYLERNHENQLIINKMIVGIIVLILLSFSMNPLCFCHLKITSFWIMPICSALQPQVDVSGYI